MARSWTLPLSVVQEGLPVTRQRQQENNQTCQHWSNGIQRQQKEVGKQKCQQHEVEEGQQEKHQENHTRFKSKSKQQRLRRERDVDPTVFAMRNLDLQHNSFAAQGRQGGCLMVIKIGTSTLMPDDSGEMHMSLSNVGKFVDLVCELRARGHAVVVVSSGAVGAGCVTLHLKKRPEQLNMKQAIASVGQCRLMRLYEDLFGLREEKVAQLLISRHDLLYPRSYQNFRASLRALLSLNVIPVINENDSLATEELRFGDNDTLAAHIAVAVEAKWLFILTDVHCLYNKNPRTHSDARPVALVDRLTDVYAFLSEQECGRWGTGGMYTKVVASKIATNMGIHVAIAHGKYPHRVLDMLSYVETHVERRHSVSSLTTSTQQQTTQRRQSIDDREDAATRDGIGKQKEISSSDAFNDEGQAKDRPLNGKVRRAPSSHSKLRGKSSAGVSADAPDGGFCDSSTAVANNTTTNTASVISVSEEERCSVVKSAGAASGERQKGMMQGVFGCLEEGSAAHRRSSSDSNLGVGRSSGDENHYVLFSRNGNELAENVPVSREDGDVCGYSENSADTSQQQGQDGIIDVVGGKGIRSNSRSDPSVDGKEKNDGITDCPWSFASLSLKNREEERAALCTSRQNKRQQQCAHAEGKTPADIMSDTRSQQRHYRWPEGDRQDRSLPTSVMICENLQQMPFLGTVFLANNLMPHKRGDKRRWILSLPVRGKLFVDKGAVEALVRQKKSLFAAGAIDWPVVTASLGQRVRHVAGNFTASECVAVYFDTCFDAIPSENCNRFPLGAGRKAPPQCHRADMRRRHLTSMANQCSMYSSRRGAQSRPFTCCCDCGCAKTEGGEDGSVGATSSEQRNMLPEASHEAPGTHNAMTSAAHQHVDQGPFIEKGHECIASKSQEISSSLKSQASSLTHCTEGSDAAEMFTSLSFPPAAKPEKRECCCTSAACRCTVRPCGEVPHNTCCHAAATSIARTPAVMNTTSVTCSYSVCSAASASGSASTEAVVVGRATLVPGGQTANDAKDCTRAFSDNASLSADDYASALSEFPPWGLEGGPPETLEIARCISNFSSAELQVIKGKKSSAFTKLLGYPVDDEVAHREHIVFTFMNGHEHLKQLCLGFAQDHDSS